MVIFGSLEAIVIESKWSYRIYRLLTEVSLKLLYTTTKINLQRLVRARKFLVFDVLFPTYGLVSQGLGTTKYTYMIG